MPELPEVETTRRGIRPHLVGRRVVAFTVRDRRLRWPVPEQLDLLLPGLRIEAVRRRAKYLLIDVGTGSAAITGTIIWHLGMSGRLRIVAQAQAPPPERHDHVDLVLDNGRCMRFTDPRRFGCVLWHEAGAAAEHPLLAALGPEPLGELLTGAYLYHRARGRRAAVKTFLMDSRVVVGIGNIYASEALYRAGIHPARAAGRIAEARYVVLAAAVRAVLGAAIAAGGTTLRDFVDEQGRPGYFANELAVYGRAGQPCPRCGTPLRQRRLAQRSTFFCPRCQH